MQVPLALSEGHGLPCLNRSKAPTEVPVLLVALAKHLRKADWQAAMLAVFFLTDALPSRLRERKRRHDAFTRLAEILDNKKPA